MNAQIDAHANRPSARRQLVLLLGLWWRHMRRRPRRLGEAPKLSGVPTFLLINLVSMGYTAPLIWRAVKSSMSHEQGAFAWHVLGVLLIALGGGASSGAGALQVRGMRSDSFLDVLPLTTFARLGLQLADGFAIVPVAIVVPLAGSSARGALRWGSLLPALLGLIAYVALFVAGQALVAWTRALGPPSAARRLRYLAVGLSICGLVATFAPLGRFAEPYTATSLLTSWWLDGAPTFYALCAGMLLLMLGAYRTLLAAEHRGFDRLELQGSAPKPSKGTQDRIALEWQMVWRQGGRALLVVFVGVGLGTAWVMSWFVRMSRAVPAEALLFPAAFVVYLGAIQTIAQAGRAARSDLMARAFLAALPLSPHQVLDGKARALRKLLIPVLVLLAMIGAFAVFRGEPGLAYRLTLAALALYVAVDGAISVAFLSNGIGVVGVGGGQASSSFSTQLLMMPLLATVIAIDNWAATISCIAVAAVTWEAKRAARTSVRWLDDPADDLERETTVWRALLAATAFFAMQAMTYRMLELFEVPTGYALAVAFGSASVVLALLTWRNGSRFTRPRFLPQKLWCWPLGALGGALSGELALAMVKLLPTPAETELKIDTTGQLVAVAITLVVMAPLAEEYFFRGWLQKAIEQDLPPSIKRWAFAFGALAFALAHIGTYGLPQLILGLIAGALYAAGGGLWPGILAHATHNAIVLLSSGG